MSTDSHPHAKQTFAQFFKEPEVYEKKFSWLCLATESSDFIPDPEEPGTFVPRVTKTKNYGAYLSIRSANKLAKSWFLAHRPDNVNDSEEDMLGRPSKNMWPGFWVPKETTEATMKTNEDGTLELNVTVGSGQEQKRYHVRVEVEDVFWEMDMPARNKGPDYVNTSQHHSETHIGDALPQTSTIGAISPPAQKPIPSPLSRILGYLV